MGEAEAAAANYTDPESGRPLRALSEPSHFFRLSRCGVCAAPYLAAPFLAAPILAAPSLAAPLRLKRCSGTAFRNSGSKKRFLERPRARRRQRFFF